MEIVMTESIHQEIDIRAPVTEVYSALTDSSRFAHFTGAPAEIENRPGGEISLFNGQISGRNVELEPGRRVVQAWRAGNWPEGVFSIARFELTPSGDNTKLVFDQAGFPADAREMLEGGWHKMYWEPMNAKLGESVTAG
jgi:activator of HSP90 ATPase